MTSGTSVVGNQAIASFYENGAFNFPDLDPSPGPLHIDGTRVRVEIDLQMNGSHHKVSDTFELSGTRIRRLEINFLS